MKIYRAIAPLAVLASSLAGGCATVATEPQMYYFSHSLLNFERAPLYPREFDVPPPLDAGEDRAMVASARKPAPKAVAVAKAAAGRRPAVGAQSPLALPRDPEPAPELVGVTSERRGGGQELALPSAVVAAPGDMEVASVETAAIEEATEPGSAQDDALVAPAAGRAAPEAPTGVRAEVLEAASRVVGIRDDFDGASLIAHVLKVSGVEHPVEFGDTYLRDLYKHLKAKGLAYDGESPLPGDLVFFHNTADANGDGRNNDWYSLCGVVKTVDEHGTVTFIAVVRGEVQELVLNLGRPEVRRDESRGAYLNSFLRSKSLSDPEYTQYLGGELYAGFASVSLP